MSFNVGYLNLTWGKRSSVGKMLDYENTKPQHHQVASVRPLIEALNLSYFEMLWISVSAVNVNSNIIISG